MKISSFICVCSQDDPQSFLRAYESIKNQTLPPEQTVICVVGVLTKEHERIIDGIRDEIKLIRCNSGGDHATARQTAIEACDGDYIAVMDADDISTPERFYELVLLLDGGADVAGGAIEEFDSLTGKIVGRRVTPCGNAELKSYMKKRCPFNHMTVMYRRDAVMSVGGYQSVFCNEDYFLWIRMAQRGFVFNATEKTVCKASVSDGTYVRRGGKEYFRGELMLQKYMLNAGIISHMEYIFNVIVRFIIQRLMNGNMRKLIYRVFLRKKRRVKDV